MSASQASSLDGGELGTAEAAQVLQKSPAWVKRHVGELGGRLVDGAYRFPAIEVERRRTVIERVTFGGGSRPDRAREAGALAARCFRLFQAAVPLEDVVTELEADPDQVLALHAKWIAMRERTAAWLSHPPPPAPTPSFDHPAAQDGSCCPGHAAARRMKESR
jgi:hypothetical protein